MVPLPDVAESVPPQPFDGAAGVATTRPEGRSSVKAADDAGDAAPLLSTNMTVEKTPAGTMAGENDFAIEGSVTVSVALAVLPVPAFVDVIAPDTLSYVPVRPLVTYMEIGRASCRERV